MSTEPGRPEDNLPRFGRGPALALFLALLLLGALYTLPLVGHFDDALPFAAVPPEGRETAWRVQGDHLQFYYYLWLVRDRLLAGASFLRDPYQFAVDGPRSNLPNTFLPVALLYVPLSALGPLVGYNLLVLLSFPLAGLSAALLVHRYGVGRWAAVVAAAVFACTPYRVGALLGGHPAGLAYFLVPLTLWGLEGALSGSLAGGAWAAVALAALAVMEPHFFYFAALGLPIYLSARIGLAGWTRDALRVGPSGWAAALAVALAPTWGVFALLRRQGLHWTSGGGVVLGVAVTFGALAAWQCLAGLLVTAGAMPDARTAARRSLLACLPWLGTAAAGTALGPVLIPPALALPVVAHAVWLARTWRTWRVPIVPSALVGLGAAFGTGYLLLLRGLLLTRSVAGAGRTLHEVLLFSPLPADLLVRANPAAGRAIYLGAGAFALSLAGTIGLCLEAPERRRRILLAFPPLLVLGIALSLGPRLPGIPLFEAAFSLVPFWNFVRQPAKFQILVGLGLGVLAALGTERLARRWSTGWRQAALPVALALLIALEYHPWRPTGVSLLPMGGEGYETIRALGARALYVPLWPGDSSFSAIYLHTTTLTRVPMLNGYSAWIDRAYVTDIYRALEPLNLGAVGEAEYAALRRYGIRQVILDRDAFPLKVSPFGPAFTLASLRASPFLELARLPTDNSTLWVFGVREHPAPAQAAEAPRSPLGIYWEAESLSRDTGQITDDPDASNGRSVAGRANRDRPGFLTFGPYRLLPAGPFRAVFRVRGGASAVELQVTEAGGRQVLGAREVRLADGGTFQEIPVPFALDAPTSVEYRVKWDGTGWAAVDSVAVVFADMPDPAPAFEVELLSHELIERRDPAASGGLAGYADPTRTPRDRVWQGPLRAYPPGRYRLWVRLKLDHAISGAFAWCGVQRASLGPVVGERELLGADVREAGQYVELAVPFTLPHAAVLEFPCRYRGGAGVWFDRLRVEGPL